MVFQKWVGELRFCELTVKRTHRTFMYTSVTSWFRWFWLGSQPRPLQTLLTSVISTMHWIVLSVRRVCGDWQGMCGVWFIACGGFFFRICHSLFLLFVFVVPFSCLLSLSFLLSLLVLHLCLSRFFTLLPFFVCTTLVGCLRMVLVIYSTLVRMPFG